MISPATKPEAASLAGENLALGDLPSGWGVAKVAPSGAADLPNCSGFPPGTLSGPVGGGLFQQGSGATPVMEATSSLWKAPDAGIAKSVVQYLAGPGGIACLDYGSTSKAVRISVAMPTATAVAAYTSSGPSSSSAPHVVIVFFAKGDVLAEVAFADRGAPFPVSVATGAVTTMAGRIGA